MRTDKEENNKFFFKISELSQITGVPSTKIRYWTKKYDQLNSKLRIDSDSKHSLYHKDSIEVILDIDKYLKNINILSDKDNINQKLTNNINNQIEIKEKLEKLRDKLKNLIYINV